MCFFNVKLNPIKLWLGRAKWPTSLISFFKYFFCQTTIGLKLRYLLCMFIVQWAVLKVTDAFYLFYFFMFSYSKLHKISFFLIDFIESSFLKFFRYILLALFLKKSSVTFKTAHCIPFLKMNDFKNVDKSKKENHPNLTKSSRK